jgi:hypothetical protein
MPPNIGVSACLHEDDAISPAELENPVEAGAARCEIFPLRCDERGDESLRPCGYEVSDCVDFGVYIVGSEPMFDVATTKHLSLLVENSASDWGRSKYSTVLADRPRDVGEPFDVAIRNFTRHSRRPRFG